MAGPDFVGVSHVALNVRDLDHSVAWYGQVLGFTPLFPYDTEDFQRRILVHPSGVAVALSRHAHPDAGGLFNERCTGLDHLSFAVRSLDELELWAARLDAAGVAHSGVTASPATGSALIAFRDPDDIQLELYVQLAMPSPAES